MTRYYRILLGKGHKFAEECFNGGYIGLDFTFVQDLSNDLPDEWRDFNKKFIPVYLTENPGKSKVTAGLACGMTWTVAKGIKQGDIVICPINKDSYRVGRINGDYRYQPNSNLPHQRPVEWLPVVISFEEMSTPLKHSARSIATVCELANHSKEIETLISGKDGSGQPDGNGTVEDPATFEMEKHLEEFLMKNWSHTLLGKSYEVYADSDGKVGQQYPTDTGPIDILAISKDKKTLLVIELKKGRASDVVVGQTLRYMGFVKDVIAESGQDVKGIIIALEDDPRLQRAIAMVPIIEFYRYEISFKLIKA